MSTLSTMPCRWTDVLEKPTSELLHSYLLQVMGLPELNTTLSEGTGDQNREDSGENLNIALTNSRCDYCSCLNHIFWHQPESLLPPPPFREGFLAK